MTEKIKKLEKIFNEYADKNEDIFELGDERAQWQILDNEEGARGFLNYCLSSTAPADEERNLVFDFLIHNEEARLDFVKWLKIYHEDTFDLIYRKDITYQNTHSWKGSRIVINHCLQHNSDIINEYLLNDNDFALAFTEDCLDYLKNYDGTTLDYIRSKENLYEEYLNRVIDFMEGRFNEDYSEFE